MILLYSLASNSDSVRRASDFDRLAIDSDGLASDCNRLTSNSNWLAIRVRADYKVVITNTITL